MQIQAAVQCCVVLIFQQCKCVSDTNFFDFFYQDESVLSPESGYDDGSRIDELIEEGRSLIAEAEQRITANRNRIASLERAVDEYVSQSDENLQEIRRNVEELQRKIADFDGRLTSNERRVGGIAQLIPSL